MLKPKKFISDLKPYQNGNHSKRLFDLGQRVMKLDSNESTVTPSPRVMVALTEFIQSSSINWYPDVASTDLIAKLALYTQVPIEFLQTFNGSDHALETICRTFLSEGDEVIACAPSYDHFRVYVESCGAKLTPVFGTDAFTPKVQKLIEAATQRAKMIYLVNPNNPTGLTYSETEIRQILKGCPESLLIVDEAYFEFSKQSVIHLVAEFDNLLVTRSFSKAFGLAGLRMGYIAAPKNILESVNKIRVGKHVNSLAQCAASAALDDLEYMERYVSEVNTSKEWLIGKFQSIGLKAINTPGNFILLQVAQPKELVEYLAGLDIYIRDRSHLPSLAGHVRISIGHQLLMERFWRAFQETPQNLLNSQSPVSTDQPQIHSSIHQ